jgi:polyphosphate kinase
MSRTPRLAGDKLSAPMAVLKKERKRKKKNGEWTGAKPGKRTVLSKKDYEQELRRLQVELVQLEEWVRNRGLRVVAIFEGRDTAGKGGVIKRMTALLNPRNARVVALPAPTERERTQWYFQRYVAHLPAAGEIVFFDRSWYNRAGVERVMGFCTDEEYDDFMRTCPQFERMLVRSGIVLVKYWLSVSDDEQERRFLGRINDPSKRWKLSPMDLQARARWVDYSEAKDQMFAYTDISEAPWYVVETDNKRASHLNLMAHFLSLIPYEQVPHDDIKLPPRQKRSYNRPPKSSQRMVPIKYEVG